jgi:hypothetical protein
LISFDFLGRIEPFQWVAATPKGTKLLSRSLPGDWPAPTAMPHSPIKAKVPWLPIFAKEYPIFLANSFAHQHLMVMNPKIYARLINCIPLEYE